MQQSPRLCPQAEIALYKLVARAVARKEPVGWKVTDAYRTKQLVRRVLAENSPVRWARWARQSATHTPSVLQRVLDLAGPINTVVDIGASDGRWTQRLRPQLPSADYLLFEANPVHYDALRRYASRTGVHVEFAAASRQEGTAHFYIDPSNPLGGAASESNFDRHDAMVPTVSVDSSVANRGLEGPFFLKLDTQGHETEIFEGAAVTLRSTALLLIEAYGVGDAKRMSFDELCIHMRQLGFRAAGIADPMVRPRDGMLWQMDIAFIKDDHQAFRDTDFH